MNEINTRHANNPYYGNHATWQERVTSAVMAHENTEAALRGSEERISELRRSVARLEQTESQLSSLVASQRRRISELERTVQELTTYNSSYAAGNAALVKRIRGLEVYLFWTHETYPTQPSPQTSANSREEWTGEAPPSSRATHTPKRSHSADACRTALSDPFQASSRLKRCDR